MIFAIGLTYLAIEHGGWSWLLLWPAASFLIVAAGYALLGARVMGKRGDGSIAGWASVLLLPYRGFVLANWWTQKTLSREPVHAEVAPGVWIGRRAGAGELPPGTALVIDLTSEFREPATVRRGCEYLCVPVLDACECGDESLVRAAIARIEATSGPVYIHCAQGHGRAGMFATALLERGVFAHGIRPPTVPEGTARLRATVMATHAEADIDAALAAFASVAPARQRAAR
jgi:hypothetical protein